MKVARLDHTGQPELLVRTVRDERLVVNWDIPYPDNADCDNAALIAAAPELLAACVAYLDAMERYGHPDKTDRLMRQAIAKAYGVSPVPW